MLAWLALLTCKIFPGIGCCDAPPPADSLAPGEFFRFSSRGPFVMPALDKTSKFLRVAFFAVMLAGAAGLVATAFQLDGWVRGQIVAAQGKGWKKSEAYRLQGTVSRYGDWPFLMIVGAAGVFVAWRARNQDWQRILVTAMVASTAAGMLVNAVRLTTGRTRPRESPKIAQGWYGPYHDGKLTIGNAKFNSFPSGHTATAVGFAGVLLFARPGVGVIAMLIALGIAWSRMLLGAHHLSDVVVASLVALAIAWVAWRTALRRGDAIVAWARGKFRRRS